MDIAVYILATGSTRIWQRDVIVWALSRGGGGHMPIHASSRHPQPHSDVVVSTPFTCHRHAAGGGRQMVPRAAAI